MTKYTFSDNGCFQGDRRVIPVATPVSSDGNSVCVDYVLHDIYMPEPKYQLGAFLRWLSVNMQEGDTFADTRETPLWVGTLDCSSFDLNFESLTDTNWFYLDGAM